MLGPIPAYVVNDHQMIESRLSNALLKLSRLPAHSSSRLSERQNVRRKTREVTHHRL